MEIDCSKFIEEITQRTITNYEFIKEKYKDEGLYEVTQLINSMYCLLVVPEEIFGIRKQDNMDSENALKTKFSVREKRLKHYHKQYHKLIGYITELKNNKRMNYSDETEFTQDYPVCSFLYSIRNALCHDGIGFLPIQTDFKGIKTNQIDDVIFQTKYKSGKVDFIAIINVKDLEKILYSVSELYRVVEEGKGNANEREYKEFYLQLQKNVDAIIPNYTRGRIFKDECNLGCKEEK